MIMTQTATLPSATDPDVGATAPDAPATDTAAEGADQLGRFLSACCTVRHDAQVPKAILYAAYTAWCASVGESADSSRTLGQRLLERGIKDHKGTAGQRCWRGITQVSQQPVAEAEASAPALSATPAGAPLSAGAAGGDEEEDGPAAVDDPNRPEYWKTKIANATGEHEAAVAQLARARERAMAATLRHRDLQDLVQAKVLIAEDSEVAEGAAEAQAAQAALQAARREVLHGERRIEQAAAALARAQAQSETARREAWARERHPDLGAALEDARARLAAAMQEWDRHAWGTPYGRRLVQGARERMERAQAALAAACAQAPREVA